MLLTSTGSVMAQTLCTENRKGYSVIFVYPVVYMNKLVSTAWETNSAHISEVL
uniref:Uncharacterized protein n=1 Tax=Anguilla anguilla TaxID=7936 RepID=A0A0E9VWB6_ANGAN